MKKSLLALGIATTLMSGVANAHEAGSWIVRAGGIFVSANSSSHTNTAVDVKLNVSDNQQLGLTGTYMFTDNIGVELLAATPFSHSIDARVPALADKGALGETVKVKQLPPSLYVQYYFLDKDAGSRPYIGAGINYTRFFDATIKNDVISDLRVKKHSVGPVLNAGIDIKLTDSLYFNTALWYTHIRTKANFKALGKEHEVAIKLDPLVAFAGLAYHF